MIRPKTDPPIRRRSRGAISKKQVNLARPGIYERDNEECVVARSKWALSHPCSGPLTVQHAVGRGSGGSTLFDAPEWLRAMCNGHNNLETSNAEFHADCEWFGWSVSRGRVQAGMINPGIVAVRYPDGRDYVLDSDNGRELLSHEEAKIMRQLCYGERPGSPFSSQKATS